jgi:hypothetical protein
MIQTDRAPMDRRVRRGRHTMGYAGIVAITTLAGPVAGDAAVTLKRAGWSFDRSNLRHYDAGKVEEKRKKGVLNALAGWVEYDFVVPEAGWYELVLRGMPSGWGRDVFVDGKRLLRQSTAGKEDRIGKDLYKEANLHLTKGKHRLRIRRLSFPGWLPSGWELRASGADPAGCVFARIKGSDIIRTSEKLRLEVTGGTSAPTTYEILAVGTIEPGEAVVGQVAFPATGQPVTRTLEIVPPKEGVFELRARANGKGLRPNDFRAGRFVAIDTKHAPLAAGNAKKTLVHDIDCVKQTDMGKPIAPGKGFWEAFGKTRVATSPAGVYREGGDNLDPSIPLAPRRNTKFKSGFSYAIDVPEVQAPYLLEVDFPDDDRRTTNIIILENAKKSYGLQYPAAHLGSGYETGDWYELTNRMQTHRHVFWPATKVLRVALVSMNPGMRAAAARVRVYRLVEGLPAGPRARKDGRVLAAWNEEPGRWIAYFRVFHPDLGALERDFVGIRRYAQICRYAGINAINPTEAVYQSMTYHSDELEGWFVKPYDTVRIMALVCEKYGLKYIPELHLSGQSWFHSQVVEKLASDPKELYVWSRLGTRGGSNWFAPTWNALHPAIQQKYIDVVGELADKVSDSPAFAGVSSRLMTWVWQSWNALPSLNWGYGDWTVAQFEKETGIKVPGKRDDASRFAKRFEFLTTGKIRDRWIAWRCAKILDYHRRLRDRIRRRRPDAVLYLPYYGDACQGMDLIFGSLTQMARGALLETGIDLNALAAEPGIAVFPGAAFGRRDSTPVHDQSAVHDPLLDPAHKALGFGRERAFAYGNAYFEVHTAVPLHKLGLPKLKPGSYCGAGEAAGRQSLEKLSVVLADQDTGFMRIGGLGYTFGRPEFYHEWLRAYQQLPKLPFKRLEQAIDPVAIWFRSCKDGLYFYAVNREPYAVTTVVTLKGANRVTRLGAQGAHALKCVSRAGCAAVEIDLKPFQLRAFKAASGARLTNAQTRVPPDRVELVRRRLAYAQQLADGIRTGSRRRDITDAQRDAFLRQMDSAWTAFQRGHYWRARTALSMTPMIEVFQELAAYPRGQLHRRSSVDMLRTEITGNTEPEAAPMLDAPMLQGILAPGGDAKLVNAAVYDPDWTFTKVLKTDTGAIDVDLDVPVRGRYRLSLGHVAPTHGAVVVSLGGKGMATLAVTERTNKPGRTVFPIVELSSGKVRLTLRRQDGFGLYGVTLQPVRRPMPSPLWTTIGPFPTPWVSRHPEHVREAMERVDPPQRKIDLEAVYTGVDSRPLRWQYSDKIIGGVPHFDETAGTSFLFRANVMQRMVCYAVTFITSPDEREAEILIGCDWWANAYLNGKRLVSNRPRAKVEQDGSDFNGWRPLPARVTLRKGKNTLLVKGHGGTVANWFTCRITDPGDLGFSPTP